MDEIVQNKLEQWDLSDLIETFIEHEIDLKAFLRLNQRSIDSLIKAIGKKVIFEDEFERFKTSEEYQTLKNSLDNKQRSDAQESTSSHPDNESNNQRQDSNSSANTESDEDKNQSFAEKFATNEAYIILNSTVRGKLVLAELEVDRTVNHSWLVEIIVDHELNLREHENYDVPCDVLKQRAKDISKLTGEKSTIYYQESIKGQGGDKISTHGKLYSRFDNMRTKLRNRKLAVKKKAHSSLNKVLPVISNEDIAKCMDILMKHPQKLILEAWEKTFISRQNSEDKAVQQLMLRYPFLRTRLGYKAIQLDFQRLYPNENDRMIKDWFQTALYLVHLARESPVYKKNSRLQGYLKQNEHLIAKGQQSLLALMILPLMTGSVPVKTKRSGDHWRPSLLDIQQGFLLHVETFSQLTAFQKSKKEIFLKHKSTIQPYPVIIGQLENIESCRIIIDEYTYIVDSPLEAVDYCFKSYYALNAKYPEDCKFVWSFLQSFVYRIDLTNAHLNNDVNELIYELNKMRE